jgi:hypothetical protein
MGIELEELYKLEDQLTGLSIGSFYDASRRFGKIAMPKLDQLSGRYRKGPPTVSKKSSRRFWQMQWLPQSEERLVVSLYY